MLKESDSFTMFKILKADGRHRKDINRLIKEAKIGSGFQPNEPIKNIWVVREEGKIVGCAGLDFHGRTAILDSLVVEKEFRHRGIGTALIKHRLEIARQRKARLAALVTMYYHFRRYKKHGFKTCPRADLPESIKSYWQFTTKRFMKCAVMYRKM